MKPEPTKQLPRSVRKHIRRQKAALRRELSPEQAKREIDRLLRRYRA